MRLVVDSFPYLALFVGCSALLYLGEMLRVKSRLLSYIAYAFVVVVPSVFAGLRDVDCGVDIRVYEADIFARACDSDSLSQALEGTDLEPMFVIINYLAALVSSKLGIALFLISLVIWSLFLSAALRAKGLVPPHVSYFLFLLGFFPLSFNLMRQCCAIAFLTLAYADLLRSGNMKRFAVMVVLGFFFHKTAVGAGLLLFAIHWLAGITNLRLKWFCTSLFVLGCVCLALFFVQLLDALGTLGGRFEAYSIYGGGGSANFKPGFLTILIIGEVLCLIATVVMWSCRLVSSKVAYIYCLILCVSIMSEALGRYSGFATRFDMYFCALQAFFLPMLFAFNGRLHGRSRFVGLVFVAVVFSAIFLRLSDAMGDTVPYKSSIIGM